MESDASNTRVQLQEEDRLKSLSAAGVGGVLLEAFRLFAQETNFPHQLLPDYNVVEGDDKSGVSVEIFTNKSAGNYPLLKLYACDNHEELQEVGMDDVGGFGSLETVQVQKFGSQSLKDALLKATVPLNEALRTKKDTPNSDITLFAVALKKDMNGLPISYETNKFYRVLSVLQMPDKSYFIKVYVLAGSALTKASEARLRVMPNNLQSHVGIGSKVMNGFSGGLSYLSSKLFGDGDKSKSVQTGSSQSAAAGKFEVKKPNQEQIDKFVKFQNEIKKLQPTVDSYVRVDALPKKNQVESKDGMIICTFVSQTRFERDWKWEEILKFTEYSR